MSKKTKAKRPTIAERGWCEYATDYLQQALDAVKQTASGLDHIRSCDSCSRPFDDRDPRCHIDTPRKGKTLLGRVIVTQLAWCPGCNIEADPNLAQAALEKAIAMNGPPKKKAAVG